MIREEPKTVETRFWRFRQVLLDMNRPGYDCSATRLELPEGGVVPIRSSDDRLVGTAHVYLDQNRVHADCVVDYHTEERLLADGGYTVRAQPLGAVVVRPHSGDVPAPPRLLVAGDLHDLVELPELAHVVEQVSVNVIRLAAGDRPGVEPLQPPR